MCSFFFVLVGQIRSRTPTPTITIKPIKKDNDYLNKLTGKIVADYQIYLKLRNDYAYSPTFYFDMANWFYALGDKETALRILTSIADLELENASLYRLLGYRFKEYGEYALEKFVCQKVIQWRPMEPQSYRDYALALADNGEAQAALDSLYEMLKSSYGIEEVAVMEINHLIAKNPNLNTSKIDKRLIIDIPVDVRVVMNWNMNNTDIDLHVIDPNEEKCCYNNCGGTDITEIGGRINTDNIRGYGPKQFILKKAIKGKYKVYADYYNDSQFTSAGPSTVMVEIYTKYADKTEQRKIVNLQMQKTEKKDKVDMGKVYVAEFEFY
jgi:tetratricopeptide (TPR) repeat protein